MANTAANSEYLLEVRGLKKHFDVTGSRLSRKRRILHAVDGVDFSIRKGETLGIVGESGCGKSTLGNTIIRLHDPTAGEVLFEGRDIARLSAKQLAPVRGDIQMIFQDPFSSLNPQMRVFDIIAEPLRTHKIAQGKALEEQVLGLMDVVGLSREYRGRFPHEFSGGQRQRIGIARALALRPKLMICDEPVSALDVSIQAQILNLLARLQEEFGLTYIFIAHGLPSVKHISTQVAVMYLGKIVELAATAELFKNPLHPYTEGLVSAVPIPDPALRSERVLLQGDMPSPEQLPAGCRFHTRCPYCTEVCKTDLPELREHTPGHKVACHHPLSEKEAQ